MSAIRKRLTYANVISTLALLLVIGGGSAYAASQFEKESIGSRALKKEAVTPAKLSQKAKDALTGPVGPKGATGPSGAAGAAGPAGAPGSAVAYAHVNADGTLDAANSKNIASTRQTAQPNYYCVLPSVPVQNVIVGGEGGLTGRVYNASFQDHITACPDGAASVEIYKAAGGTTASDFFIVFN
jgi:hypothetical protein